MWTISYKILGPLVVALSFFTQVAPYDREMLKTIPISVYFSELTVQYFVDDYITMLTGIVGCTSLY